MEEETMSEKTLEKKKFNFPHTIVFMLALIILFAALTWIIPAGKFETEVVNGRTLYIPGTYHQIERCGQGPWKTLQSIQAGFIKNAAIFFMIFIYIVFFCFFITN